LRQVLKRIPTLSDKDVFLDIGSGKGRVVVTAATFPFKRVIGVEISPELTEAAEQNRQKAHRHLRTSQVELVTIDATAYVIPPDVSVIFLYNPFHGEVLKKVFDNIRASLVANPRDLTIIYRHPYSFEGQSKDMDWLVQSHEYTGMYRHIILKPKIGAIP
jgi:precorrin-6B methylase 2